MPTVRLAAGLDHVPISSAFGVGVDDTEQPSAAAVAATAIAANGAKEPRGARFRMVDSNRLPNESRVSRAA